MKKIYCVNRKMEYIEEIGKRAKKASIDMGKLSVVDKNRGLKAVAEALISHSKELLEANMKDVRNAKERGIKASLVDRLQLTEERIKRHLCVPLSGGQQRDLPHRQYPARGGHADGFPGGQAHWPGHRHRLFPDHHGGRRL